MKSIYCLLILVSTISYSQRTRPFGSVGGLITSNSPSLKALEVGAGVEYRIKNFIRPEFKYTYIFGFLNPIIEKNIKGYTINKLERNFSSSNLSFSPKINFGDSDFDSHEIYFQLIPIVNLSFITAKSAYYESNGSFSGFVKVETDSFSEVRKSLGIGIGMYYDFNENYPQTVSLNLLYQNIDFGNAISNIKNGNNYAHTYQSISFEIVYYFNAFKINKK